MANYKELFEAIETIARKVVAEESVKVYSCIVVNIGNNNKATIVLNGKENSIVYYGNTPVIGREYRVFVPSNNMSNAFIIVP